MTLFGAFSTMVKISGQSQGPAVQPAVVQPTMADGQQNIGPLLDPQICVLFPGTVEVETRL